MSYFRMTAFFVLAALAHWWWSSHLLILGLAPQLLLVLTVIAASRMGPIGAMCFGFAWGLYLDVFDTHLFGAKALSLTLVGYGVGSVRRQIDVSGLGPLCAILLPVSWGFYILPGLLGWVFKAGFMWVGWSVFLLGPIYNCLIIPLAAWAWEGVVGKT